MADRIEHGLERAVYPGEGLAFRQGLRGQICDPADSGAGERFGEPGAAAGDKLQPGRGELGNGAGIEFGFDQIARDQDRAQHPSARTGDISRKKAVVCGEEAHHRAMLSVGA